MQKPFINTSRHNIPDTKLTKANLLLLDDELDEQEDRQVVRKVIQKLIDNHINKWYLGELESMIKLLDDSTQNIEQIRHIVQKIIMDITPSLNSGGRRKKTHKRNKRKSRKINKKRSTK